MILQFGLIIAGLIALVLGGEMLVRGAVRLAERARVSPLMIGLVIVGFGTSTPELVTSLEAAMAGSPAIAWGNIIGSNLANSLLILGAATLIAPIAMTSNAPLRDPVVALVAAIFLFGMIASGLVGVMFGALMLGALATYIFWCYREERAAAPALVHNAPHDRSLALELSDSALHGSKDESWLKIILLTIAGLATLVVGGKLLVSGAITLATLAGLSEAFIGLTIVAIGTSLPELATSLIAARKGESDVAFGNIIGSNIYNILGIGGATMLIMPEAIDAGFLTLDVPLMTASAALICFLAFFRRTIGRFWGAALLLGYFAYLGLLVSNI